MATSQENPALAASFKDLNYERRRGLAEAAIGLRTCELSWTWTVDEGLDGLSEECNNSSVCLSAIDYVTQKVGLCFLQTASL